MTRGDLAWCDFR